MQVLIGSLPIDQIAPLMHVNRIPMQDTIVALLAFLTAPSIG